MAAVRRRGRGDGSDDEDLGLPQSPPASPPTDKVDKVRFSFIYDFESVFVERQ